MGKKVSSCHDEENSHEKWLEKEVSSSRDGGYSSWKTIEIGGGGGEELNPTTIRQT